MRHFVTARISESAQRKAFQQKTCEMVGCKRPKKDDQEQCHVCSRWVHLSCVHLERKGEQDFVCPICIAQYE